MAEYEYGYEESIGRARERNNNAIAARLERTGQRVALARIERERRRLAIEEARILARPEEPTGDRAEDGDADGPVVFFRKTFGDRSIPNYGGYQYAAVRTQTQKSARWFLTGPRAKREAMTWDELLDFVVSRETDEAPPKIWVATEWNEVEWNGQGQQD